MSCLEEQIENLRAEVARLQEAKRRALLIADERAKEAVKLRARLAEIAAFNITPDTGYSVAQAMRRMAHD